MNVLGVHPASDANSWFGGNSANLECKRSLVQVVAVRRDIVSLVGCVTFRGVLSYRSVVSLLRRSTVRNIITGLQRSSLCKNLELPIRID